MSMLRDCPPGLEFVEREVLEYDVPGLRFESPPVVLDIGANIGAFAMWAHRRWPGAKLSCYEPHPAAFELLHINAPAGSSRYEMAVGAEDGEAALFEGKNLCCGSLLVGLPGQHPGGGSQTVRVRDAAKLPPCDVLKIDTEGAELAILQRYPHLAQCQAVLLEWHRDGDRQRILDLLRGVGLVIHSESGRIIRALSKEAHARCAPPQGDRKHLFLSVLGWKLSPFHAESRERLIIEAHEQGWDLTVHAELASGLDRGRNITVALMRAKCPEATHLMFIDSDIGFDPADVTMMLRSGFPIVGGAYPKKAVNWKSVAEAVRRGVPEDKLAEFANDFVCNAPSAAQLSGMRDEDTGARFAEVDHLGTGFLMISAAALDEYIRHYGPEIEYRTNYEPRNETHHKVFQCETDPWCERERAKAALLGAAAAPDPEDKLDYQALVAAALRYRGAIADPNTMGNYLSEDYSFCARWKLMGGHVICYLDAHLVHHGAMVFQGHLGHMYGDSTHKDRSEDRL